MARSNGHDRVEPHFGPTREDEVSAGAPAAPAPVDPERDRPPRRDRPGGARRTEPAFGPPAAERHDGPAGGFAPEPPPARAARQGALRRVANRKAKSGGRGPARNASKPQKARRRRSFIGHLFRLGLTLCFAGALAVLGVVAYHFSLLPPLDQLTVPKRAPNVAILAADGSLIANKGDMGGREVRISELPPYVPKAFVAIEDRRFYEHHGVDPLGVARAMLRNVSRGGISQGGSTLTQQLAKNLFLTQDRTLSRKIQEVILSLWLEQRYTKDQILEMYMNRVYFGAGAYGVEAAAHRYFGKPAKDLTLAEAAMLAGLVQAPARLAPTRNPEGAQSRARLVLAAMADEGFITERQAKNALMTPAVAVKPGAGRSASYAADYVMEVLDDFVGKIDRDVVVHTTIDMPLQTAAEAALNEELGRQGGRLGATQGAVVTLAADGAVKALVGGRNYADSQFNRATRARRQPGSVFKPFVYLAALEAGLTPDTVRDDSPVSVGDWSPANFSRRYSGPVTLMTAMAHSLNTIPVKLALELGPKQVVRAAQRLGVTSPLAANASIALGTSEVTPLELTAAYAAFANGGIGVVPYVIESVSTPDGKNIYKRMPNSLGPVINPRVEGMINAMLRAVTTSGTASKAKLPGWDVGGKTGTSQDFRDAWFVGFTNQLVTTVWIGNDDNSPMKRVTGGSLPLDVWNRVMPVASRNLKPGPLPGVPWIPAPPPAGLVAASQPDAGQAPPPAVAAPPRREPNFFERLFGG
ncbi:transglycosylase domain-containing protein [Camelimonas abortus]|uniref:peptidoglycan glycosyltransferase n=1 Tax=Camelimonas abortus TaxID=1017184 RepID=A0ABV7LIK8_9HYPH